MNDSDVQMRKEVFGKNVYPHAEDYAANVAGLACRNLTFFPTCLVLVFGLVYTGFGIYTEVSKGVTSAYGALNEGRYSAVLT